jgi:hypothetical protein
MFLFVLYYLLAAEVRRSLNSVSSGANSSLLAEFASNLIRTLRASPWP